MYFWIFLVCLLANIVSYYVLNSIQKVHTALKIAKLNKDFGGAMVDEKVASDLFDIFK